MDVINHDALLYTILRKVPYKERIGTARALDKALELDMPSCIQDVIYEVKEAQYENNIGYGNTSSYHVSSAWSPENVLSPVPPYTYLHPTSTPGISPMSHTVWKDTPHAWERGVSIALNHSSDTDKVVVVIRDKKIPPYKISEWYKDRNIRHAYHYVLSFQIVVDDHVLRVQVITELIDYEKLTFETHVRYEKWDQDSSMDSSVIMTWVGCFTYHPQQNKIRWHMQFPQTNSTVILPPPIPIEYDIYLLQKIGAIIMDYEEYGTISRYNNADHSTMPVLKIPLSLIENTLL